MPITKKSAYYEFEIELDAVKFSGEYADCGSHVIAMKITATRSELEALANQIAKKLEEQ